MKVHSLLIVSLFVASTYASEYPIEKYREFKEKNVIKKLEEQRALYSQKRDLKVSIRDYRDIVRDRRSQKIYSQVEARHALYR